MNSRECLKMSARSARYQKRIASRAIASLLKIPDTKDSPITILSSSDDDKDVEGYGLAVGVAKLRTKKSTTGDEKLDRNPCGEGPPAATPETGYEDDGADVNSTVTGPKVTTVSKNREQGPLRGREADVPGTPLPDNEASNRDIPLMKGESLSTESTRKTRGSTSRRRRGRLDRRGGISMEVGGGFKDRNGHASSGAGGVVHSRRSDLLEGAGAGSIVRKGSGNDGDGGDKDGDPGGGDRRETAATMERSVAQPKSRDEIEGGMEERADEDDASGEVEAEFNTGILAHQANAGHGSKDDLAKLYGEEGGMGDTRSVVTGSIESDEEVGIYDRFLRR